MSLCVCGGKSALGQTDTFRTLETSISLNELLCCHLVQEPLLILTQRQLGVGEKIGSILYLWLSLSPWRFQLRDAKPPFNGSMAVGQRGDNIQKLLGAIVASSSTLKV